MCISFGLHLEHLCVKMNCTYRVNDSSARVVEKAPKWNEQKIRVRVSLEAVIANGPFRTGPAVQKLRPVPNLGQALELVCQIVPISCQF